MSLTPPSQMGTLERFGAALIGVSLLALMVIFLGNWAIGPNLTLLFAGAGLVSGGILLTKKNKRLYNTAIILMFAGVVGLVSFIVKDPALVLGISALAGAAVMLAWSQFFKKNTFGMPSIVVLALTGVAALVMKFTLQEIPAWGWFALVFGLIAVGTVIYSNEAFGGPAGIKNHGIFHSSATRPGGAISWALGIVMTGFYVLLYFYPSLLHGAIAAAEPLQKAITGQSGIFYDMDGNVTGYNQWFLYGFIYTVAVLVMGYRYIMKYRHNKYQIVRTISVAFFQLVIAFTLPMLLNRMNNTQTQNFQAQIAAYNTAVDEGKSPDFQAVVNAAPNVTEHYFHYFWPLGYSNLQPGTIEYYTGSGEPQAPEAGQHVEAWMAQKQGFGTFGKFAIWFSLFMSFGGVFLLTYFFGKRWYCSWVCGCGGLAETAGDPFRQMSDKSLKAWRIERVLIHSVLVLVTVVTALLLLNWKFHFLPGHVYSGMKTGYGFLIGQMFAGVIGTGFYPILGSRVWCRFGCPQAAILGLIQKYFSRFRITTNGGQCISCGNCSTYCEMGIDVKQYAQRGENIIRASCVGCGVCSAVCPRGVLNLENGPTTDRYNGDNPIAIERGEVHARM